MAPKPRIKATDKAAKSKAKQTPPKNPQAETMYNLRKRERPDLGKEAEAREVSTVKKRKTVVPQSKKVAPVEKARAQKAPKPTAASSSSKYYAAAKSKTLPKSLTKAESAKTGKEPTHKPTPTKSKSKSSHTSLDDGREIKKVPGDSTNKAGSTAKIQPKQNVPGTAKSFSVSGAPPAVGAENRIVHCHACQKYSLRYQP
ncbi:uncharacterized protein BDZ99DRAFT_472700 [Mytilinidion resinicola]|uniref:Uncharacterized protein n=1 Tax=Mytilinidion resinicola TaxID=574789 RepID=A0A6A6Z594_9PEZI|nr:uncharacterized protein BDZ99DRAFT_472700 [Mytilinidion resinicola]KAF2815427.1 hypothetical protein BDZ99DRAFT_472700 [Mytilinidion resinicola]